MDEQFHMGHQDHDWKKSLCFWREKNQNINFNHWWGETPLLYISKKNIKVTIGTKAY